MNRPLRWLRDHTAIVAAVGVGAALVFGSALLPGRVLLYWSAPLSLTTASTTVTTASTMLAPPVTQTAPGSSSTTGGTVTTSTSTSTATTITAPPGTVPIVSISVESEATLRSLTDDLRASLGVPPVAVESGLEEYARTWAIQMATSGVLQHSSIDDLLGEWLLVGENVGLGTNAATVFDALVASPEHLTVMVDVAFTAGGVGAAIDAQGRLWVCQVFAARTLPPTITVPTITVPTVTLPTLPGPLPRVG